MPAKKKKATKRATIHELPKPEQAASASAATRHAKAPEVERVANELIPSPGMALSHLRDQKILFLFSTAKQIGCNGFVATRLFPAWARTLGKFDFLLVVSKNQWDNAPERVRLAAVAHGLSHCEISDRGAATIAHHDYEDFGTVAKRYGAWSEGGRIVQLKLLEREGKDDAWTAVEESSARAEMESGRAQSGNGHQQAAD